MPTYQGACHCGAVTFRLAPDITGLTTCDCSLCRQKNALMTKLHARAHRARRRGSAGGLRTEYPPGAAFILLALRRLHVSAQARRAGSFRHQRVLSGGCRSQRSTPANAGRVEHDSTNKNAASRFGKRRFVFEHRKRRFLVLGRPGSDLLSQGLSHSTIGAEEFNGRVRDGIGLRLLARTTRPAKDKRNEASDLYWRLAPSHFILVRALRPYGH